MTIKSQTLMKENEDFRKRYDLAKNKDDIIPIEIIDSGLIVQFGEVNVKLEEHENEIIPKCKFHYNVVSNPHNITIGVEEKTQMGDIIMSIILDTLEEQDEPRENYFKKSSG